MQAVIFDWDGVVIDSSAQHERSWELLAAERSLPLPPGHFKRGFGKKNQLIIPEILEWSRDPAEIDALGHRKEELYRLLVRESGVVVLPGARELLAALLEAGIPAAVGSSTPRANLEAIFAATGLDRFFQAVVCGDDVRHGKPAPDVFLQAAARLHTPAAACLVIEDAHVGIQAAHAAGIPVLAVATTHPLDELATATAAVSSLREADPPFLQQVWRLAADRRQGGF